MLQLCESPLPLFSVEVYSYIFYIKHLLLLQVIAMEGAMEELMKINDEVERRKKVQYCTFHSSVVVYFFFIIDN